MGPQAWCVTWPSAGWVQGGPTTRGSEPGEEQPCTLTTCDPSVVSAVGIGKLCLLITGRFEPHYLKTGDTRGGPKPKAESRDHLWLFQYLPTDGTVCADVTGDVTRTVT